MHMLSKPEIARLKPIIETHIRVISDATDDEDRYLTWPSRTPKAKLISQEDAKDLLDDRLSTLGSMPTCESKLIEALALADPNEGFNAEEAHAIAFPHIKYKSDGHPFASLSMHVELASCSQTKPPKPIQLALYDAPYNPAQGIAPYIAASRVSRSRRCKYRLSPTGRAVLAYIKENKPFASLADLATMALKDPVSPDNYFIQETLATGKYMTTSMLLQQIKDMLADPILGRRFKLRLEGYAKRLAKAS